MDVEFNCSTCGQHLIVDDSGIGLTVSCPTCGKSLTIPPNEQGLPPPGVWIRAQIPHFPAPVIAFTYDDPAAGRSAKGGVQQKGMQTEMTLRFPGGCDTWEIITPTQVEGELLLPPQPEWLRAMVQVPTKQEPSNGSLPTAFDLAVDRYLMRIRESRTECGNLNDRGVVLWRNHDMKGAMALFRQAHTVAEQADDRYSLANAIGNEALVISSSDPGAAVKTFAAQESLWRELGPKLRPNLAAAIRNEVMCLLKVPDVAAADKKLKDLEGLAQLMQNRELIEWTVSTKLDLSRAKSNQDFPWRRDPKLQGQFSDEYPDDLIVEFRDPGNPGFEGMWVRIQGVDGDGYYGTLLNEPKCLKSVRCGDIILFRKEVQDVHPRFIKKRG